MAKKKKRSDSISLRCMSCDEDPAEDYGPPSFIAHYERVEVTHEMSDINDANAGLHETAPGLEFSAWAPDPDHLECSQCGETYCSTQEVIDYSEKQFLLEKRRASYALKNTKAAKKARAKRVSGTKRR